MKRSDPAHDAPTELDRLLAGARAADAHTRITFRDPIANHGVAGIKAVAPWMADPQLGAFAVRVIERAAGIARPQAVTALRRGRASAGSPSIAGDIDDALERLRPANAHTGTARAKAPTGASRS
jgi:hypothetical protein